MPLARVSVPVHLSQEKVQALANAAHNRLNATRNVRSNDRFQFITRFANDAMTVDAIFPHFGRTADASLVEISLLQGRSDDPTRHLYQKTVEFASLSGFVPDDIMTVLYEKAPIDCSRGRGKRVA